MRSELVCVRHLFSLTWNNPRSVLVTRIVDINCDRMDKSDYWTINIIANMVSLARVPRKSGSNIE